VVATEVSKSGVAAAKRNFELNGMGNVFVARMSSEEFTQAWKEGRKMNRCAAWPPAWGVAWWWWCLVVLLTW
jgi:tRNA/tmRNA/rRNA uracil-C5-methylase (TrmA/RlmC/RlmD family)